MVRRFATCASRVSTHSPPRIVPLPTCSSKTFLFDDGQLSPHASRCLCGVYVFGCGQVGYAAAHGESVVAGMEHVMVRGAERYAVVDIRQLTGVPFGDVVGVAPAGWCGAGGPYTSAVSNRESFSLRWAE